RRPLNVVLITVSDMFLRQEVLLSKIILRPISCGPLSGSPAAWESTPIEAVDDVTKCCLKLFRGKMATMKLRQGFSGNLSSEVTGELVRSQIGGMGKHGEDVVGACILHLGIGT